MVKGTSRQVIVVWAPEEKLFEQAIFILKDGAVRDGISDETLLRQARGYINAPGEKRVPSLGWGPLWGFAGAGVTGVLWLLTVLL